MSACELILLTAPNELPEALRDPALAHLAQATRRSLDELRALLCQPRPLLAVTADEVSARGLQADLRRAGWHTELRLQATQVSSMCCGACAHANAPDARFCAQCGAALAASLAAVPEADAAGGLFGAAVNTVAGMAGLQGVQRFSLRELLSEVFKRRSPTEMEDYLLAGTLRATPPVAAVRTDWPRPWLFARVFVSALALYLVFHVGWLLFANPNLLPALMMVGSFVVPFAALLLFYEFNAPRNVSLMLVLKLVLMGGAWSLLISLLLFDLGSQLSSLLGASAAGLIEETGKLAAVVYATRRLSPVRYRYTLNGLLFGAAVGAGFSAFESAGYAFRTLLAAGNADAMSGLILLRGVLSPFGHVVWTALAAGALWRVKGAMSYSGVMLADGRFLRILLVSVLCHVIWNSDWAPFHPLLKYPVLGFIAWAVALSLVQDGLLQVRREQASLASTLSPSPP